MTKAEYKKLLEKHDWYYMFSDDDRVYQEGLRSEQKLKELFKHQGFEELYKEANPTNKEEC